MEILVLEASTTSAKAMLYHAEDGSFEVKTREYTGCYDNGPSEHRAEAVYQSMLDVGRELAEGKPVDIISLSSTWQNLLLCDQHMTPVTSAYPWNYMGASELCRERRKDAAYVQAYYQKTGCMVSAIYPFFKLELLRQRGIDVSRCLVTNQGAYNTYRMTGQRVSSRCVSSGSGFLNTHTRDYDPDLIAQAGIRREQLSQLTDYHETFPLNAEAAGRLGLKAGIPVMPANADGGLNQVGAGALRHGVATLSVGTSGAIRLTTDRPVLPENPGTWCYLSPKSWLSGAATNGCCNCVDWARTSLFPAGTSYQEIEAGSPDGSDTPVFLPFLFGERCPGWGDDRLGGFLNLKPQHTASDCYRAVQEGVLFNLYHCYRILSDANQEPSEVKLSGGILNSPRWKQMCADIFGRSMTIDNAVHSSMMGGAVLACELLGQLTDVGDYQPEVVGSIEPDLSKKAFYEERFARYLAAYEKTRP